MAGEDTARESASPIGATSAFLLALLVALAAGLFVLRTGLASGREWWALTGAVLLWLALIWLWVLYRAQAGLALAVLMTVLALQYLVDRPGGWYDRACPHPDWDDIGCDAVYYRGAVQALHAGEDPFARNWYPPPFLYSCVPVLSGPGNTAFASWWLVVFASWACAVVLTYALVRRWHASTTVALAITAVVWLHNWPGRGTAADLQVNFILLACILAAWAALGARPWLSGLAMAAATLVKLSPALPSAFVALTAPVAWTGGFALGLAVPVGLTFLIGPQGMWGRFLAAAGTRQWESRSIDTHVTGLLGEAMGPPIVLLLKLAILAWAIYHLVAFARMKRADGYAARITVGDGALGLGIICMVVLSPVIWPHHRVWLVAPVVLGWLACHRRWAYLLLAVTACSLWLQPPPRLGMLFIVVPPLVLLWLLHPRRLAEGAADSSAQWLVERLVFMGGDIKEGGRHPDERGADERARHRSDREHQRGANQGPR